MYQFHYHIQESLSLRANLNKRKTTIEKYYQQMSDACNRTIHCGSIDRLIFELHFDD